MKFHHVLNVAQILNSDEGLFEYLDWVASQGGGYEIYLQHLIVRGLRGLGIDVSIKGKKDGDCDLFIEGEGVELKTPRKGWGDKVKEAFEGHPDADGYLFVIKGKYPDIERKDADTYIVIPLERIPVIVELHGEDWWVIGVQKLCEGDSMIYNEVK